MAFLLIAVAVLVASFVALFVLRDRLRRQDPAIVTFAITIVGTFFGVFLALSVSQLQASAEATARLRQVLAQAQIDVAHGVIELEPTLPMLEERARTAIEPNDLARFTVLPIAGSQEALAHDYLLLSASSLSFRSRWPQLVREQLAFQRTLLEANHPDIELLMARRHYVSLCVSQAIVAHELAGTLRTGMAVVEPELSGLWGVLGMYTAPLSSEGLDFIERCRLTATDVLKDRGARPS